MIYLLDESGLDLIKPNEAQYEYINFDFWECQEERVRDWLRYERAKSTFTKQEIINKFGIKDPIQMVQIKDIRPKKFDKIIIWTHNKRYFVFKIISFI